MAINQENQAEAVAIAGALKRIEVLSSKQRVALNRVNSITADLQSAVENFHTLCGQALAQHCDTLGLNPDAVQDAAGGPKPNAA